MADDVATLRKEALQIAKRIQRHLAYGAKRSIMGNVVEDDALALADRVVKMCGDDTVAKE